MFSMFTFQDVTVTRKALGAKNGAGVPQIETSTFTASLLIAPKNPVMNETVFGAFETSRIEVVVKYTSENLAPGDVFTIEGITYEVRAEAPLSNKGLIFSNQWLEPLRRWVVEQVNPKVKG